MKKIFLSLLMLVIFFSEIVSCETGYASTYSPDGGKNFLDLLVLINDFKNISQFEGEFGKPSWKYPDKAAASEEVSYQWKKTLNQKDRMQMLIVAKSIGKNITGRSIKIYFDSMNGESEQDYDKAEKFFIETCRDYEKRTHYVSKIRWGGNHYGEQLTAYYPLAKDSLLAVSLMLSDDGVAENELHISPKSEASKKLLRVKGDKVRLRKNPSTKSPILEQLEYGMEFYVLDTRKTDGEKYPWYGVTRNQKTIQGWIYGEFLEPLKELSLKQISTRKR